MKNIRFTEEKIIEILKLHAAGGKVGELCRQHGISEATRRVPGVRIAQGWLFEVALGRQLSRRVSPA